jgi:hypothetical protein
MINPATQRGAYASQFSCPEPFRQALLVYFTGLLVTSAPSPLDPESPAPAFHFNASLYSVTQLQDARHVNEVPLPEECEWSLAVAPHGKTAFALTSLWLVGRRQVTPFTSMWTTR